MKSLICLFFAIFFVNGEPVGKRFDSYKVYRIILSDENQIGFLFNLQKQIKNLAIWIETKKLIFLLIL